MILTAENLPKDLQTYTFNLVLMDLDEQIGECICHNEDDSFTVFINARWSIDAQRLCFEHALNHVRHNDWELDDVDEIEARAHRGRDN